MPSIQTAIYLARDLVASPRVSMLVDDNLIELSGNPDVNIVDMDIRISGHSHSPDVEINSLETEVELADVEISIDDAYAYKVMVDYGDLADLAEMLEAIGAERLEAEVQLAKAKAELAELRTGMVEMKEMINFYLRKFPEPTLDLADLKPPIAPQPEGEVDWYI